MHKIAVLTGGTLFALAVAFAQTPPASQTLGKNAQGRFMAGPSLVSDKVAGASADELHGIIANGKGRMPKYAAKLSTEEIDTLVQEVKVLNKK